MKLTRTIALATLVLLGACQKEEPDAPYEPLRKAPWPEEVLARAAELPLQDRGRVKPLSTFAGFQLLKMKGSRRLTTPPPVEEKLDPTAWLLDCFFFPEDAANYETFLVQDSQVLVDVGLEGKHRRDRYTYRELVGGREKLFAKARELVHKETKDLDALERQMLGLATNLRDFEDLTHFLDFARYRYTTGGSEGLEAVFGENEESSIGSVLAASADLRALYQRLSGAHGEGDVEEMRAATRLMDELEHFLQGGGPGYALFAPPDPAPTAEYLTPLELVPEIFAMDDPASSPELAMMASLGAMAEHRSDPPRFAAGMADLHEVLTGRADARGDFSSIPLEISFYGVDYFYRALVAYLLAFLLVAISWMLPGSVWLQRGIWGLAILATGFVVAGVTMRCVIRSRPPILTLYDTILFITGVIALVCMGLELINRQRIALATSTVLGALGMFLAGKYEFKEAVNAGDTMPSLVAVLDTNFWLATHVTTINMGYAAGLLASALAHVWIVGKIFGLKRHDAGFYRNVSKMMYGVICFALLFSVVGTILGGVWANYSWGRFWGWDPKENGALLICLWQLIIIHLRLGGYAKQFGLAVLSVLGGVVVAFSWWGVNLLNVGLHSYGFTSGVALVLGIMYLLEFLVVIAACVWKLVMTKAVATTAS